jgi:hypothetical protein
MNLANPKTRRKVADTIVRYEPKTAAKKLGITESEVQDAFADAAMSADIDAARQRMRQTTELKLSQLRVLAAGRLRAALRGHRVRRSTIEAARIILTHA